MSERQFWNFASLQPAAEKPWVTFIGRALRVPLESESNVRQVPGATVCRCSNDSEW